MIYLCAPVKENQILRIRKILITKQKRKNYGLRN
jgi:hypothetical protein